MKLKLVALATLSGILLSLAWLGISGIILSIAFVPLFYIDHYFVDRKASNTPIIFWGYSLITFLIWNGLTTWWIAYATIAGALFALLLNSLLMSLVWLLVHIAHRIKGSGFAGVFLIFIWVSFEYLHFKWELSWPWLTLGNGLANDIVFIQWYEYTGVFGGTLWILLINLFVWTIFKKQVLSFESINKVQWSIFALVALVPIVFSIIRYKAYSEVDNPVNVVLAQPNIDPYNDKFDRMSPYQQYRNLIAMADSLGNDSIDFFVGPETALHSVWQNHIATNTGVKMIRRFIVAKHPDAAFIVGAMTYKKYNSAIDATQTAQFNDDSTLIFDAFNSVLLITSDSTQMYHKSKLVPGVEKMPFQRYLRFMDKLVIDLGGTTGELATQNSIGVFSHKKSIIGVPICYESVFGGYVANFINNGANLLFVITNDGWWKNSPGYRQHLSYSRIQAIQFRRSIARSANTGISCFINQKGEITQKTRWWEKTALVGQINSNDKITFYAMHGDYLARISVFMFLLMGLSLMVATLKRDKNKPHYPD